MSNADKTFPTSYLVISVLTLVLAFIGTLVSVVTVVPEQQKLRSETEKIRKDIDEANRKKKADAPRISPGYFYVNSDSELEKDEDRRLDPKAGPQLGNLPKLRIPDYSTGIPSPKEWIELSRLNTCGCRYFYEWLSKRSPDGELGKVTPTTSYLVLQQTGKAPADDIELTVDRVKLEVTTNAPPFENPSISRGDYGPVERMEMKLGSLEPGYGLRVPVGQTADFAAEDLSSAGNSIEVPESNAFYYGVLYIPRKLSYNDPINERRVELPIRGPNQFTLGMSGDTGSGG